MADDYSGLTNKKTVLQRAHHHRGQMTMEWNNFNLTVQQFLGCGDKLMMGILFGICSMYPFSLVSSAQAAMGGWE